MTCLGEGHGDQRGDEADHDGPQNVVEWNLHSDTLSSQSPIIQALPVRRTSFEKADNL